MSGFYTEADYESSVIELFQNMGYQHIYAPDLERDFRSPLYEDELDDAIHRLNPTLPEEAISDALYKLKNFENAELVQKNELFMEYLQYGIEVRYFVGNEERSGLVYLVDYKNPDRNSFIIANQWSFVENSTKRPDILLFLNGLPIVLMELKSPSREETDASEAYTQIRNYMHEIPSMFIYNCICVMSDQLTSKAGTITSGEDRFMEWKTKDGDYENTQHAQFDTFFEGIFQKERLLDIIKNFICFSNEGTKQAKILAGYHQYFAVKKAIESTKKAIQTDGKGGVFWHTQGSGKSLSMVFYAHLLQDALDSPTIVVITDRNDLDDQLYGQFAKCRRFLRQDAVQADKRKLSDQDMERNAHLRKGEKPIIGLMDWLNGRKANGIIFTTMQKFEEAFDCLSERRNIIVMADEAHRSQYGLKEKVDIKTGEIKIGTARVIRNTLPNATYIGFTGTPIFEKNKGADGRTTADVFYAGDKLDSCLHRYMIKDAIADGNVLRFSVEYQRTIFARNLAKGIDPEQLDDPEYCKRHKIDMEPLYHDDERIASIAKHIFEHHEQHVHPQGKDIYTALFAVDKIQTLGKYYDAFKKLNDEAPTDKRLKVAAIFSYEANEDMDDGADEHSQELLDRCMRDYNALYGTAFMIDTFDAYRKDIAKRLKQKDLPQVDILLVVNMFLTGFDAKPLNTLYLDKNLIWHSLVQAYSRTNRVDKVTKQFGQIVSYRNIKQWQDDALTLFSGDGDPNEYLLENYEYYVNQWINQEPILRKITVDVDAAGQLKSEDEIRMFIIAFRSMAKTLATLKTFSKFDWDDLAVVMDENEYEGFKSWYLYYRDQTHNPNPKVPVPVDVDFDIELVRTDRINVVYILNLLKNANTRDKSEEEKQQDVDLILREMERSDNESLRLKKEVMRQFILTRFYDLPEDADIMEAFTQFEKEQMKADMEEFAFSNKIDYSIVSELFTEYVFHNTISDDDIRKRLTAYKIGLLKMTKLTKLVKSFVEDIYNKYKAEGE